MQGVQETFCGLKAFGKQHFARLLTVMVRFIQQVCLVAMYSKFKILELMNYFQLQILVG